MQLFLVSTGSKLIKWLLQTQSHSSNEDYSISNSFEFHVNANWSKLQQFPDLIKFNWNFMFFCIRKFNWKLIEAWNKHRRKIWKLESGRRKRKIKLNNFGFWIYSKCNLRDLMIAGNLATGTKRLEKRWTNSVLAIGTGSFNCLFEKFSNQFNIYWLSDDFRSGKVWMESTWSSLNHSTDFRSPSIMTKLFNNFTPKTF